MLVMVVCGGGGGGGWAEPRLATAHWAAIGII